MVQAASPGGEVALAMDAAAAAAGLVSGLAPGVTVAAVARVGWALETTAAVWEAAD